MTLHISQVFSGLDFERFINFQNTLYANAENFTPTLKAQDKTLLDVSKHPFWQTAEQKLFLAQKNNQVVGRLAAIIDHKYNQFAEQRCGTFGFFDCINDLEVASKLFDAAITWFRKRELDYIRGPFNPSANYTCGLLVHGFDATPAILMPYNFSYYATLLEELHFYKEEDLFAYRIYRDKINISDLVASQLACASANNHLHARPASKQTLAQDIKIMLDLYKRSWAKNLFFSPLSKAEEDTLVKELVPIVDTNFFVLFYYDATPVAGMVALPNLSPLLKALQGQIDWRAPYYYFKTKHLFSTGYRIMLYGILEEYRLLGLPALLFNYMLEQAQTKPDLKWVEGSWVLESNYAICDLIEDFSGTISQRYRIYRKEIEY